MMGQIKHALSFVFGAIYTSAIWVLIVVNLEELGDMSSLALLPFFVVIIGTVIIVFFTITFLANNWDKA